MAKVTVVSCDHCGTTTEKVFHFDRVTREGVFVIENQDYCLKCLAEVLVEKIVEKVVEVPTYRSSSSSSGRSGATGRPLIMEEVVRTAPLTSGCFDRQLDVSDSKWCDIKRHLP